MGTPYNQVASDLISSADTDNYTNGPINFLVGSLCLQRARSGQDTFDARPPAWPIRSWESLMSIACCATMARGISLRSICGAAISRDIRAGNWHRSCRHTAPPTRTIVTPGNNNIYYWALQDNTKGFTTDYALNTTSGNRPPRVAPTGCKAGQPCYYVAPQYIFNGDTPQSGQTYRASLAMEVTKRFPVRPRRRELPLGAVLRHGHRRSAGYVRFSAARSG